MKQFSQDWHTRHIENWNKFVVPNLPKDPTCLEIGCFEGMSTCWICENIKPSCLDVVDTFNGSEEHEGMGIDNTNTYEVFLKNTEEYKNIHVSRSTSLEVLINTCNYYGTTHSNVYDFIHVDGSHMASDVFYDACLSWRLLKQGGIIVFDDYRWSDYVYGNELWRTPKPALDGFMASFYGQLEILEDSYQLILKKL